MVLWQNGLCRVVQPGDEPDYPGFLRVILHRHVRELTDLDAAERQSLMAVAFAVEEAVRETMEPDKMNLASLGNLVPHVHWHVIPRFADDRHYPGPVWAPAKRDAPDLSRRREQSARLPEVIAQRLQGL